MKIRNGFVSNSSSSSFVCDVCGTTESGWDLSITDIGMVSCENGHTFCEHHGEPTNELITKEDIVKHVTWDDNVKQEIEYLTDIDFINWIEDNYDKYDLTDILDYEIPEHCCPICTFKILTNEMFIDYVSKKFKFTRADVMVEILKINKRRKKVYYKEFVEYILGKGLTVDSVTEIIQEEFETYIDLYNYIYE